MRNINLILLALCLLAQLGARAQADTVLKRYRQYLLSQPAPDVSGYANSWNGRQWEDIDYADKEPSNWKTSIHLRRTRDLALAWSHPQSPAYHRPAAWKQLNDALQHWLQKRYRSGNWWHNKIGVPQHMRDVLVLLKDTLDAETFRQSLTILEQNDAPSWQKSTGANLTWCADLALHYGALTANEKWMDTCAAYLWKEVRITTGDGIQPDFSFHQHSARLQMFQYGRAYLQDNVRLAWELRGTRWAYPPDKLPLLDSLVRMGWQWMARGIYTVPGTVDRSVSRPGALKGADLRAMVPNLTALFPAQAAAYRAMSERMDGKGAPLQGFRYWPRSDFAAYHRPGFTFFLKTLSDRTLPTESINHENLRGRLLHMGDGYIISNGKEYTDLMPVWDWDRIPGIVNLPSTAKAVRKPFAGSVGNGVSGATAMDYTLDSLEAFRFWACHNDRVVCLNAGKAPAGTYTVLDQSRLLGPVHAGGQPSPITGNQTIRTTWLHHRGIAWIPVQTALVRLRIDTAAGAWKDINASTSADRIREKIFLPTIGRMASYVIAAAATPAAAAQLRRKPDWKIVKNDTACQAVKFSDGTLMAAFREAGNVEGMTVNGACLLMWKGNEGWMSAPTQKATEITLSIGNAKQKVKLPADGTTVRVSIP